MSKSAGSGMARSSSGLLAKSNGQHLHQTASQRSIEISVWFHSIDRQNPIRLECGRAEVDRDTVTCDPKSHRFHAGGEGHAHTCRRNPESFENMRLTFRCGSAMASHCGNDERGSLALAQLFEHSGNDDLDIGDSPAANAYGDSL